MLFTLPVGYRAVAAGMDAAGVGDLLVFVSITFRSGSGTTVAVVRVDTLNGAVRSLTLRVDTRRLSLLCFSSIAQQLLDGQEGAVVLLPTRREMGRNQERIWKSSLNGHRQRRKRALPWTVFVPLELGAGSSNESPPVSIGWGVVRSIQPTVSRFSRSALVLVFDTEAIELQCSLLTVEAPRFHAVERLSERPFSGLSVERGG